MAPLPLLFFFLFLFLAIFKNVYIFLKESIGLVLCVPFPLVLCRVLIAHLLARQDVIGVLESLVSEGVPLNLKLLFSVAYPFTVCRFECVV